MSHLLNGYLSLNAFKSHRSPCVSLSRISSSTNSAERRGIPYLSKKIMQRVVAFGNPLLDTTIFLRDRSLLDKYNLKVDDQLEIPENEMKNLSRDISEYQQFHSAGGCSQNSLRVLQWLTGKKCEAIIFGSVGRDDDAETLRQLIENDGVQTRYIVQSDLPTGKTIALVSNTYRSLVAYIGAAEKLPLEDLLLQKDFHDLVLGSDFVYIEGFFLTNRIDTAKYILDFCNKQNKVVIFNICGEYVCNLYPQEVQYFVENSDVVFGNKREFVTLSKTMKFKSTKALMNHLVNNGKKKLSDYGKIIIVTNDSSPGACFYKGGNIENFTPIEVNKKDIKDTTGAGDAFTGGFIAGLCRNKTVADCAKIGCYAASQIIQQIGCTLPNFHPDILD